MTPAWLRTAIATVAGLSLLTGAASLPGQGPLTGRVIVIDPGHGGRGDPGCSSRFGLKEAHVNLMVGLRLAALLRADGADVILTRTTDSFVASDDAVTDLAARAQVANDHKADLFLSIHHNDTLSASDPRNDTQVYWKLDDQGPSRDFAKVLLPRLAQSLNMARQQLLAGNFAVLRRNQRPAILGEAGYLSNPVTARALAQSGTQQKEADAYAAAIRDYFGRGVPRFGTGRWETAAGSEATVQVAAIGGQPAATAETYVLPVDGDGATIASVSMLVDGEPVDARYDAEASRIVWRPDRPLANGPHALQVEARNAAGNAAIPLKESLTVDRPVARIEATSIPGNWNPEAAPEAVILATVLDGAGLPVIDGTPVTLSWGSQIQTVTTRSGKVVASMPWPMAKAPLQLTAGAVTAAWSFDGQGDHAHLALTIVGHGEDQPWAAVSLDGMALPAIDRLGTTYFDMPPGQHNLAIQARGYEPWAGPVTVVAGRVNPVSVTLAPRHGGVLLGRRIMLDPFTQDGRPEVAGRTLSLAMALKARLEAAGAIVNLSRTDNRTVAVDERCRQMTRSGCELYIGLDQGQGSVAHYYTSIKGSKLARLVVATQSGLRTSPEATYMVTHSPCTAVVVRARQADTATANGLFEALKRYYAS
jgi:N-acetylmuramoyl-L-alanine amidase